MLNKTKSNVISPKRIFKPPLFGGKKYYNFNKFNLLYLFNKYLLIICSIADTDYIIHWL